MSQGVPQPPQLETESIDPGNVFDVPAHELDEKPASPAVGLEAEGNAVGLSKIQESSYPAEGIKSHRPMIFMEAVEGADVVGECSFSAKEDQVINMTPVIIPESPVDPTAVTVIEALEAAGLSARDKLADDQGDAAAASFLAEMRSTSFERLMPGGLAAEIQSAAARKARRITRDDDKITLKVILEAAANKLMDEDDDDDVDEGFVAAIIKNNPSLAT